MAASPLRVGGIVRFRYSAESNGKPVKKALVFTQDEHRINFSDVDAQAVYIIERLQANGYETYIVGGAVRDLILGKKPKDFDIVTAASPAKIKKIFRNARIIGRRFRLVHVFFGDKIFEVSTFRSMKDGPTSNTFGTIEEDVLRRDFSLNALFYDPLKQLVVDYVGGMKDMRKRIIRPIIPLPHIFTDDPVRMIRAVKYGAVSGFKLPLSLKWRIRRHSGLLAAVSPSRLTEEIFKIINSPYARQIVENLDALGLYCYLQPQAEGLFKAAPAFKAKYLKTMGALHSEGSKNPPGQALSALVRDYLEDAADWIGNKGLGAQENAGMPASLADRYKRAFLIARQFVLPMNPPRAELDAALRLLFAEHGVSVKKMRFNEHRRGGASRTADSGKPMAARSADPAGGGSAPNTRRRKRRKRTPG
ncbi:MAG: polynucleotide adenylyltransferase PcnB [Treponema sp.]|nr:polynucleotide adenylyltransferase PcnB [Treponema sp.]